MRALTRLDLHIETSGAGPRLVLAHGFAGSARNFRPQARAFAPTRQVRLYDARGHARSPAPEDPAEYALSELVGDLDGVVSGEGGTDSAAVAAPSAVVGGLSLGAYTALRWALGQPSSLGALVLASFPSPGSNPKRRRWALGFADAIEARGLDAAGAEFVWGERSRFDPKGAALIRQGFLEHAPHALAALLRRVLADLPAPGELSAELASLRVPTLVIAGELDTESLEPSRELARLIPGARLEVIPAAGHIVNLAQPAAFNAVLTSFLESL